MKQAFEYGPWLIEYTPEDGARLDRLAFNGYDLSTVEPAPFRRPAADYGEYENRPVYGYDDCFPSVEVCPYPDRDWTIPDHGELCWLAWDAVEEPDGLIFSVRSKALAVLFKRELRFTDSGITWAFEVINEGDQVLPFQHVMHPLMPMDDVIGLELPPCGSIYDDIGQKTVDLKNPQALEDFLLSQPAGTANMLFLRDVQSGKLAWTYRNGLRLEVTFPEKQFPAVGIWWNKTGYPDEDGCRRNECAFEPVPGNNSRLSDAHRDGRSLSVRPGERCAWQIQWRLQH